MKRNLIIAAIMMFGLVKITNAAVVTADLEDEPAFLQDYIKIKNALVNDHFEQVKEAALEMQKSLEKADTNKEQHNRIKDTAVKLANSGNIKAQRQHFGHLSQLLYQLVKSNDISSKTLYLQHYSMAIGGQGANWLSYQKQVRNPYMGQKMPSCGSIEETIN